MKTLYLVSGMVRIRDYYGKEKKSADKQHIVWADDCAEAESIFEDHYNMLEDGNSNSYSCHFSTAIPALGQP